MKETMVPFYEYNEGGWKPMPTISTSIKKNSRRDLIMSH